jgi:5-methylcytosine-specific restriction endonuclease McrA
MTVLNRIVKAFRKLRDPRSCGEARSPQWEKVRDAFLKTHDSCAICDGKEKLNVHHKKPFHLFPEDELKEENLVTLCEAKGCCEDHLEIGHGGNFKYYNKWIEEDITKMKELRAKNNDEEIQKYVSAVKERVKQFNEESKT